MAHRILLFALPLLFSVLSSTIVVAQGGISWNRTPEIPPLTCHYLAVTSDGLLWCTDEDGIYSVDPEGSSRTASYRYFAKGSFTSIWAGGSTLLAVDAATLSGENRLVRSTDNGKTWREVPIAEFGVEPVLLRTDDAGRLFLGCTYATLLASSDSGRTWNVHTRFESLASRQLMIPNSISGKPGDYVCSVIDYSRTAGGQLNRFYRHEGGEIWTDISLTDDRGGLAEWEIARLNDFLLLAIYFDYSNVAKMAVSGDNGKSWHLEVGVNPGAPTYSNGPFLHVDPLTGRIYTSRAITWDRSVLTYSDDLAESFTDLTPDGILRSVVSGPDGTSWFVVGESSYATGVSIWKEKPDRSGLQLALDPAQLRPEHPMSAQRVLSIVSHPNSRNGIWLASVESSGVWRTTDYGRSWFPISGSVWDTSSFLYFAHDLSVYSGSKNGVARLPHYNADIWEPVVVGTGVRKIAVSLDRGVIAESLDDRLIRIDDEGNVEYAGPSDAGSASAERLIAVDQYNRIFAADTRGLYVLRGFAPVWTELNSPVPPESILSLAAVDVRHLLLGTTQGVFRSDDLGASWSQTALTAGPVSELIFAKSQLIREYTWVPRIVARLRDSIWSTTDTGVTWDNATGNLPPGDITAIATDPYQFSLMAAVNGEGVFWSNRQMISSVGEDRSRQSEQIVRSLPGARLEISLADDARSGYPDVQVFDVLGRPIAGGIDWMLTDGTWKGVWHGSVDASGVALVRIQHGAEGRTAKVWLR